MNPCFILACAPMAADKLARLGIADYQPPPGSVMVECLDCKCQVWVGPSQQRQQLQMPTITLCFLCAIIETEGKAEIRSAGGKGGKITMKDGKVFE